MAETNGSNTRMSNTIANEGVAREDHRIESLYDTPQERWSVEQWRALAIYLSEDYMRVVAALGHAVSNHERTIALLKESMALNKKASLHAKVLRMLDDGVRTGRIAIASKPHRKKSGRKKKLSAEREAKERDALVVLAARHSPTKAAELFALWQMKHEGLSPVLNKTQLAWYKKTWANKIGPARKKARQDIVAEFGRSLEAYDRLSKFKLLGPKRRANPPESTG